MTSEGSLGAFMGDPRAFLERIREKDPAQIAVLERTVAALPAREAACSTCDGARFVRGTVLHIAGRGVVLADGLPALVREIEPCPDCGETATERLARSGLPERMRGWSFDTFPGPAEARDAVRAWAEEPRGGVLVHGLNGRGKTGLAAAAVVLMAERGTSARWWRLSDLQSAMRARFGEEGGAADAVLEAATAAPVLVIDDVGAVQVTAEGRATPWGEETVFRLLDGRIGWPTLVTVDVGHGALVHLYGPRVGSRLREYESIEVGGEDLRGRTA